MTLNDADKYDEIKKRKYLKYYKDKIIFHNNHKNQRQKKKDGYLIKTHFLI